MRVLYPLNSPQIGGGNRSLLTLWKGLAPRGVTAGAAVEADGPMRRACEASGVGCVVLSFAQPEWNRPIRVLRGWREWRAAIRAFAPDLVHSNDLHSARSIAGAALGLPHVCHVRSAVHPDYAAWAFRRLPRPHAFVFNSRAMYEAHREAFERFFPAARLRVVHNAVDLEAFRPAPVRVEGPPRVGILANLLPVKGHEDFLAMARLLEDRGTGAEYWIVGGEIHADGARARLEDLARRLGVASRTRFLGHRDDVPDLLAGLDVVVCASRVEPFGRCLIEAMATARPVVATRVGGIPEVVADGETGVLVPPGSPTRLAAAVAALLDDPERRGRMGEAGRRRAESLFGIPAHAAAVHAIYDELLSRREARLKAR